MKDSYCRLGMFYIENGNIAFLTLLAVSQRACYMMGTCRVSVYLLFTYG